MLKSNYLQWETHLGGEPGIKASLVELYAAVESYFIDELVRCIAAKEPKTGLKESKLGSYSHQVGRNTNEC